MLPLTSDFSKRGGLAVRDFCQQEVQYDIDRIRVQVSQVEFLEVSLVPEIILFSLPLSVIRRKYGFPLTGRRFYFNHLPCSS